MPAASAAVAFSLICTGTLGGWGFGKADPPRPARSVYQVDLASKRFCSDTCVAAPTIAQIKPTYLMLSNNRTSGFASGQQVNLETGAWFSTMLTENGVVSITGTCRKGPFGGLGPK